MQRAPTLPRVRRSAQFWLSAGAVWQHLLQLEQPFESPALEHKFRLWSTRQRMTTAQQFSRACIPFIHVSRLYRDGASWIRNPIAHLPDMVLVAWGQTIIWISRESMVRNAEAWTSLIRFAACLQLFTRPIPLVFAPLQQVLTLAGCSVMPLCAEGILTSLAGALTTIVKRILALRDESAREALRPHESGAAGCEATQPGRGFWSTAFDIISIHVACEAMVVIALVWRRRRERTRFRDELVRLSEAPPPAADKAQAPCARADTSKSMCDTR